jgi:hypothetical protein
VARVLGVRATSIISRFVRSGACYCRNSMETKILVRYLGNAANTGQFSVIDGTNSSKWKTWESVQASPLHDKVDNSTSLILCKSYVHILCSW